MTDDKPQGKNDPKGWSNGDVQDLRDSQGGTYGEISPAGTPDELVIQPRAPHQNAQHDADVVIANELPEGLKPERKGRLNKSGRAVPK